MTILEGTPRTRPIYRREYEALGELGFFADEKVELLDGRVVLAADEGGPHAAVNRRLNRILVEAIPAERGEVGVGNPLAISDLSEPEPDFMVVDPVPSNFDAHPTTASLVIEVSHASRRTDLGVKAEVYAAAWITRLLGGRPRPRRDRRAPRAARGHLHRRRASR